MSLLRTILGLGPKVDLAVLIKEGAIILDVRTKGEFQGGHARGSVNIPLDQLQNQHHKLNKNKPVITCCASGMRSAAAKGVLKSAGFSQVYNGGSWQKVSNLLKK